MKDADAVLKEMQKKVDDKSTLDKIFNSDIGFLFTHLFDSRSHAISKIKDIFLFLAKPASGLGGPPLIGWVFSMAVTKAEKIFKETHVNDKLSANLTDIKYLIKMLGIETLDTSRYKAQHAMDETCREVNYKAAIVKAAEAGATCTAIYFLATSIAQARRRVDILHDSMRVLVEVGQFGIKWCDDQKKFLAGREKEFREAFTASVTSQKKTFQSTKAPPSLPFLQGLSSRGASTARPNRPIGHTNCEQFCICNK